MRSTLIFVLASFLLSALAAPTLPENLFFYTKLEAVAATDETGRQPTATAIGTPELVDGYSGKGLRFNANAISFGPVAIEGDVSYSAWFKIDTLGGNGKLFSNKVTYDTDPLGGEVEVTGTQVKYVRRDKLVDEATYPLATGVWTHVVVIGSAGGVQIYINGSIPDMFTPTGATGQAILNPSKAFSIGSSTTIGNDAINAGGDFKGVIDEVRIYNITLTDAQAKAIFAETFDDVTTAPPTTQPPVTQAPDTQAPTAAPTVTTPLPSAQISTTVRSCGSTAILSFFVIVCAFLFLF